MKDINLVRKISTL